MFADACRSIRECIYGLNGMSEIAPNQVNGTNSTGFMIAPGIIATAAHFCHIENDPTKPTHTVFEAIRSPDIGQNMEKATLIAQDAGRDVALLRINAPRSDACITFAENKMPAGEAVGSLGFPLAQIVFLPQARAFNLVERFQSASISAYGTMRDPTGRELHYYETDSLMYRGSSGCPGFLVNGRVFGMHVSSIAERAPNEGTAPAKGDGARLAISIWVPAKDIVSFARANGVQI